MPRRRRTAAAMWRREEHTDTMMNFEDLVQQQKSPSTPSSVITSTTAGDPDVKLGLGLLGDAASGPKPGGGAREADANCQQVNVVTNAVWKQQIAHLPFENLKFQKETWRNNTYAL